MKFIINLLFIILAAILQITFIPELTIFSGIFNLIFLIMLMFVFASRPSEALWWAGLGGIVLDLLSPVKFGFYTLSLLVICLLTNYLVERIFTDPNIFVASGFFFGGSLILNLFWLTVNPSWQAFFISAIYNTVVGTIIYGVIKIYQTPREAIKI